MGYNSTIVVMNDALNAIGEDPEFGRKLEEAILCCNRSGHAVLVPYLKAAESMSMLQL